MRWTTCLFDMDGTLVDTIKDLADATETVLRERGFGTVDGTPVHSLDEYRLFVGNGIPKLMERALGDRAEPSLLKEAVDRLLTVYNDHCLDKTAPYEGVLTLLDELKARGITLGVVTNKPEPQARLLADTFFAPYGFHCVYGGVAGRPHKPEPYLVSLALADCRDTPATTLFIGDSNVDVATAHNAGLLCAGACWGFRGREELEMAGADILLEKPQDLLRYL